MTTGKQISESVLPKAGLVMDFSPDGRQVLSSTSLELVGETDAFLQVWEISSGKALRKFELPKSRIVLAATPRWQSYLSVNQESGTLQLWDCELGKELRRFEGHKGLRRDECLSHATAAVCCRAVVIRPSACGTLRAAKSLRPGLEGHKDRVNSVAFSPTAAGVSPEAVTITVRRVRRIPAFGCGTWNQARSRRSGRGERAAVMHVAISPDGRRAILDRQFQPRLAWGSHHSSLGRRERQAITPFQGGFDKRPWGHMGWVRWTWRSRRTVVTP